jgi:hypothetical protein
MNKQRRIAIVGLAHATLAIATARAHSAFEDAELDDVIAKFTGPDFAGLGPSDQIFVPPMFRYRLKLAATGAINPISTRRREAVTSWAKSNRNPEFAEFFTHEVEIERSNGSLWLPWQSTLVDPFRSELKSGGTMSVRVLFIGAIQREFMFVSIGYQKL